MFTPKLVITSWLMFLFLIIGIAAKAQPVAAFSATPLSGCAPLVVNFVDQSTGAPTQWKWDLGNSTISFLQNPSVTYFNPGTYSIKLVVQNAAGRDSVTRTQYIHVTAQPSVSFAADKVTGCFPLPVTFTDNSTPGTGTVTSWQWDFGDGNFSGTQTASHTYTAAGDYNISLRVGNSAGCFKTLTRPLYIHINEGVNADFTHSQPNTCTTPVSINFQNQSAGTGTLTYEWNFGDGSQSTDLNPSHTYTAAGTYSVSLIAINSTGCRDTITQTDAIIVGGVNADFLVPQVLCQGAPLNFQNTSAPAPVSASWSFGDGTVSSVISPVKVFATAGTFPVKLVSNFGACLDSVTHNVTVLAKPVTSFTADKTAGCNVPFTVHFTSNVTGANSYKWDFGDGGSATFNSPTHTYTQTGLYNVSLITGNSAGCYDTLV
ncbi:MAG: PKD domain-containing protein, partial [Sphingobacteriales bacterium]